MSLKTMFLLCFAVACLPGAGWSTWSAVRAHSEWLHAAAAVRMAEAMGDALHLLEVLPIERGLLQERALSDGPINGNLAAVAARDDALLDRAQISMQRAGLPVDAVARSREILVSARAQVAEAILRPRSERDPGLVPALMASVNERLGEVDKAVAQAEREATQADARVGAIVAVGSLAIEMRAAAGWRSTNLSAWMGGVVLTPAQLDDVMYVTGKVAYAWDRVQRQVLIVGDPPRLAAAIAATRDGFWRLAEPRYREVVAIARAGGERPMTLPEWRRWTVKQLEGTLFVRDAAIAEAVDYGAALAFSAAVHLAIAGTSALSLLVLAVCALLVLLRRLILPLQRLTAAVTRLADGDVSAPVPERGRLDEIGAMAAAIEVFRANAVTLRRTNLRFDAALSNISQGLAMFDAEERLVVSNARLCEMKGLPPGSLREGMTFREVLAVDASAGHFPGRTLEEVYAERRGVNGANRSSFSSEEMRGEKLIAFTSRPVSDGGWLLTLEDITERRHNEARIVHMAHHDALTGMPNRVLFQARLEDALAQGRRGGGCALLYLDLDQFKAVNDTLGHPMGDALLRAVSIRLEGEIRETDTVARLGGDEFAILQTMVEQPAHATALAERIINALSAPYQIDGQQIDIGVSIGIAVAGGENERSETLLKNADLALYRAKLDGRGTWRFFEPEMDAHMQARRLLELELRRALEAEQFEMYYQPVVNLRTRLVAGFEALVRWRHPERGLVSPAAFIPLAEEIGLIGPIGEWVLLQACTAAAGWSSDVKVAVNLSAVQFRAGHKLADMVAAVLRDTGLPPARLELEITETAMLRDTEETLTTLHRMRDLGVAIALDDFGTGYSSLSHLRRFPFDRVKIDQSFVRSLGSTGSECGAIVRAIMTLCETLGIAVTAEGVETEAQRSWLAATGPIEAQGYLFSQPVPAEAVAALIETLTRAPPSPRGTVRFASAG